MNKQGASVAVIVMLIVILFYLAKAVADTGNQAVDFGWVPEKASLATSFTVPGKNSASG